VNQLQLIPADALVTRVDMQAFSRFQIAGIMIGPRALPDHCPPTGTSMKHQGFLEYQRFRYLKAAWWLTTLGSAAYIWHRLYLFHAPGKLGYGGTWPGYVFGTTAAALVVWLAWLGIRKRRYDTATSTQGWLSAHVYLGCAVVVLASLHCGFELGWNTHSLAYLLLWVVVASGIYGVVMFSRIPTRLTDTVGDTTLSALMLQLRDVDAEARRLALTLPDQYNSLVLDAATNTRLQGTAIQNLVNSTARHCATARALAGVEELNQHLGAASARAGRELYGQLVKRKGLVDRIRQIHMLMSKLRLWLLLHVPMALALLVALVAHVVSVFIYW
jgi:hypothetical protein